eukprot:1143532-Pelagomonas_calceolata.AAC.3
MRIPKQATTLTTRVNYHMKIRKSAMPFKGILSILYNQKHAVRFRRSNPFCPLPGCHQLDSTPYMISGCLTCRPDTQASRLEPQQLVTNLTFASLAFLASLGVFRKERPLWDIAMSLGMCTKKNYPLINSTPLRT